MKEATSRHSFLILDGMRGIAAIGVLLFHFKSLMPVEILKAGYLATDLFFCLSGFVIAHAYEGKLRDGMSLGRFAMIRMIRLWPLVALGMAIGFARVWLTPSSVMPSAQANLFNLFLLPAFSRDYLAQFPLNPPHWSLFYEMAINLAYAGGLRRLPSSALLALSVAGFVLFEFGAASIGHSHVGWAHEHLLFGFGRVTCTFLIGVVIYREKDRWKLPFGGHRWWLPLFMTGLVLTLPVGSAMRPFFDALFILVGAGWIVWAGAAAKAPATARHWLAGLANLSYPLYALHFPFFLAAEDLTKDLPEARFAIALSAIVLTVSVTWLAARYYDAPFRRALTRKSTSPVH